MLKSWLLSLHLINQHLLDSNFSSADSSPLSAFTVPGSLPGGQGRSRERRGGRCRKKNGDADTLEECSSSLKFIGGQQRYIGEKAKTDINNGRSISQKFPKSIDKLLRLKST